MEPSAATTAEDENMNGAENESHNMNHDDDDVGDVNATHSSSRETKTTATATSRSRTPPATVLPICCILDSEKGLFRVTRSKGKTLAAGGFGITINNSEQPSVKRNLTTVTEGYQEETLIDTATNTPLDDDDDNDDGEDATTQVSATSTPKTPNTSNSYLFIEEVLFLHERGMIECYRYDDDGDNNNNNNKDDSKLMTSIDNGECTTNDTNTNTGLQQQQQQQQTRLDSYELYNMLEQSGGESPYVSLPIYLVYAYLLQQDYRVLRHFHNRRDILDAMEQEKTQSLMQMQHDDNDKDEYKNDPSKAGEDGDRVDHDNDKEDTNGAGENKDATITNDDTTDVVRRKRKKDNMPGLKALRLQLRREAAQAPPPVLCNTDTNINNSSDDDDAGVSIAFDVYRPNSNFSRGAPGLPDFYVAATHFSSSSRSRSRTRTSGPEPQPLDQDSADNSSASLSFEQIQRLLAMSAGRSLKIATVSDAGTVIMFGITDHGVPAIFQQGESSSGSP